MNLGEGDVRVQVVELIVLQVRARGVLLPLRGLRGGLLALDVSASGVSAQDPSGAIRFNLAA